MATYIGVHEVDDVDHWLHSPKRQELFGRMGITGQLFTDTAKSNRVGLILEIPDMEAFQQLLQSQAGADAMKFDGVRPVRADPGLVWAALTDPGQVIRRCTTIDDCFGWSSAGLWRWRAGSFEGGGGFEAVLGGGAGGAGG